MVQYSNPNPSKRRTSPTDLGPTLDPVVDVDPSTIADITPGSEYATLGMGRPGQISFGPDARSAFYRPVPKAMDDWLTPVARFVSAGVGALEQADKNAMNEYQMAIDDLQTKALDTSNPSLLHQVNDEGVIEPNWDAVAERIELLNKKYGSMYTIKGNLSIRSLGLKNRTENAVRQGQNLEHLWDKEFVRLQTEGYSATEIAEEFDTWFSKIKDPYVHQALEQWKEKTIVNYQAAILQEQDRLFSKELAASEQVVMEMLSNPDTFNALWDDETNMFNVAEAREIVKLQLMSLMESNQGLAIPPGIDGMSGFEEMLEKDSPRTRSFTDTVNKIAAALTVQAIQRRKVHERTLMADQVKGALNLGGLSGGERLLELQSYGAKAGNVGDRDFARQGLVDMWANWNIANLETQGFSTQETSAMLAVGAYVDWWETEQEEKDFATTDPEDMVYMKGVTDPALAFGSPESIAAFQNQIDADMFTLDDVDNHWFAGAGDLDSGGLVAQLKGMDPTTWVRTLDRMLGGGTYQEMKSQYEKNLPDGYTPQQVEDEWVRAVGMGIGTAYNKTKSSRNSSSGSNTKPEPGSTESIVQTLVDSRNNASGFVENSSVRKLLENLPNAGDAWTFQNFQNPDYQALYLAMATLVDKVDFSTEEGMVALGQEMQLLLNMDAEQRVLNLQTLLSGEVTPEGLVTEEAKARHAAFRDLLSVDKTNSTTSRVSPRQIENEVTVPLSTWLSTSTSEPGEEQRRDRFLNGIQFLSSMSITQRHKALESMPAKEREMAKLILKIGEIRDSNGNPRYDLSQRGWLDDPEKFRTMLQNHFMDDRGEFVIGSKSSKEYVQGLLGPMAAEEVHVIVQNKYVGPFLGDWWLGDWLDPDDAYLRTPDDKGFSSWAYNYDPSKPVTIQDDEQLRLGGVVGGRIKGREYFEMGKNALKKALLTQLGYDEEHPNAPYVVQDLLNMAQTSEEFRRDMALFMSLENVEQMGVTEITGFMENFAAYLLDDIVALDVGTEDKPQLEFRYGNRRFGHPDIPSEARTIDYSVEVPSIGNSDDEDLLDQHQKMTEYQPRSLGLDYQAPYKTQSTPELSAAHAELSTAWVNLPEQDRLRDMDEYNRGLNKMGIPQTVHPTIHEWVQSQVNAIEEAGHTVLIGDVKWLRLLAAMKFETGSDVGGAEGNVVEFNKILRKEIETGSYVYFDGQFVTSGDGDPLLTYWRSDERFEDGVRIQGGPRWWNLPLTRGQFNPDTQGRGYLDLGVKYTPDMALEGITIGEIDQRMSNISSGIFSVGMYKRHQMDEATPAWRPEPYTINDIIYGGTSVENTRDLLKEYIDTAEKSDSFRLIQDGIGAADETVLAVLRNARSTPELIDAMVSEYYRTINQMDRMNRGSILTDNNNYFRQQRTFAFEKALARQARERTFRESHNASFVDDGRAVESRIREIKSYGLDPVSLGLQDSTEPWSRDAVIAGLNPEGSLNMQLASAIHLPVGPYIHDEDTGKYVWYESRDEEYPWDNRSWTSYKNWWGATDKTIPLTVMRESMGMEEEDQQSRFELFNKLYVNLTDLERKTLSDRVGIPNQRAFVAAMMYADFFDKTDKLGDNVVAAMQRRTRSKFIQGKREGDRLLLRIPSEGGGYTPTYKIGSVEDPKVSAKRRRLDHQDSVYDMLLNADDNLQRILLEYKNYTPPDDREWKWGWPNREDVKIMDRLSTLDKRTAAILVDWYAFKRETKGWFGLPDLSWDEWMSRFILWRKNKD